MDENFPTIRSLLWMSHLYSLGKFFILNEYCKGVANMNPRIGETHYEIKGSDINILLSFQCFENEKPYQYLDEFLDVCRIVRIAMWMTMP